MDSDKQQTIVVAGAGVLLLVVLLLYVFAGQPTSVTSRQAVSKPFTARGETRDKALTLSSSKRDMDVNGGDAGAAGDGGGDGGDEGEEGEGAGSRGHADDTRSEAERLADEAKQCLDPEEGIRRIKEYLDALKNPAEASKLHSVIAELYAAKEPPDYESARRASGMALTLAQTDEDYHRAGLAQATVLQTEGKPDEAMKSANAILESRPNPTADSLALGVLLGNLEAQQGNTGAAERAYARVVRDAEALMDAEQGSGAVPVYRQASLRLSDLYRDAGRKREADALRRSVKRRLAPRP